MESLDTETGLVIGFIVLLILVISTIIGLLIYSGLFTSIDIKTCKPSLGDLTVAYKYARGPYKESGSLFTQCHTLLPQYRTVGVYYDDPRKNEPQQLRYIVGLILSENKDETVNPEEKKLLEENGFKFAHFPSIDHGVETSFPFNSTISIIIAVMKVYPALTEYIESRSLCAHPFLEVYDNEKKEILFMGPLVRQHDFYVPQVIEDEKVDDDDDTVTERSWDESVSVINSDDLDKSSSVADSSVCRLSQDEEYDFEGFKLPLPPGVSATPTPSTTSTQTQQSEDTKRAEDSDANTASSFEEIDEKEVSLIPEEENEDQEDVKVEEKSDSITTVKGDEKSVTAATEEEAER